MFAKSAYRPALCAVAALALALGAASASAQTAEVSGVKVTATPPTSIRLNVTGLGVPAVLKMVRVAATTVCQGAVERRQLDFYDGDWCASATIDRTMVEFRHLRDAQAYRVAAGPETLTIGAP
jgi:hypothetical protein